MGFAFDESTGLPVVVGSESTEQWSDPPAFSLHVQPEPALQPQPSALQVQPQPTAHEPESEIGDIMLRVQRFADETADDARRQARSILADAHVEAAAIVTRARREAEEVASNAVPQIAPESVGRFCGAIEEFAATNRVLVDELSQLRQTLVGSYADTPVAPGSRLSSVPPVAG